MQKLNLNGNLKLTQIIYFPHFKPQQFHQRPNKEENKFFHPNL